MNDNDRDTVRPIRPAEEPSTLLEPLELDTQTTGGETGEALAALLRVAAGALALAAPALVLKAWRWAL